MPGLARELWQQRIREFHYVAMELLYKHVRKQAEGTLPLIEHVIVTTSWWDTVDFLAARVVGEYFKHFPKEIPGIRRKWMDSCNIWLQRTVLLFQPFYKTKTDTTLLGHSIRELGGNTDFFIRKAIGWALRQYARTNPEWVRNFVGQVNLSGLSTREAMKHL